MKKALIVGINEYMGSLSDLRGCVNDATNIRNMVIEHFGFTGDNIRFMLDLDATTENIKAGLEWLVAGAKPGDVLLFHFSGHGSQMVDKDKNMDLDYEPDGLDEILAPCDLNWRDKVIKDDDLKEIFDKVPDGVNLTVILDCCNSGGALDSLHQYQPGQVDAEVGAAGRFLPPPEEIQMYEPYIGFKPRSLVHGEREIGLLISTARSYQTAADAYISGDFHGAGTYYLVKSLTDANFDLDYKTLVNRMNDWMIEMDYTQRPELNGDKSAFYHKFLQPFAVVNKPEVKENKKEKKLNFFQKLINWIKNLFS